jgi:hypothetical protein
MPANKNDLSRSRGHAATNPVFHLILEPTVRLELTTC